MGNAMQFKDEYERDFWVEFCRETVQNLFCATAKGLKLDNNSPRPADIVGIAVASADRAVEERRARSIDLDRENAEKERF